MNFNDFWKKNSFYLLFSLSFIISTLAIYLNFKALNWDYLVYYFNGNWFFSNQFYFEWIRPPLAALLIGFFSSIGFNAGFFAYYIFVLILFFTALYFFSKKFNLTYLFAVLVLFNPIFIKFAFSHGSELLALTLLLLSLNFYPKKYSGFFFGLQILTRYNFAIFLPLFFILEFSKGIKKRGKEIALNLGSFALTALIPCLFWFAYNFLEKQDFLFSITDSLKFNSAIGVFDCSLFFVIIIAFFVIFYLLRNSKYLFFSEFLILALGIFLLSDFSQPRFMFSLIIPISAIVCTLAGFFKNTLKKFVFFTIMLVLFASVVFTLSEMNQSTSVEDLGLYEQVANDLKESNCAILSNKWIYLTYNGLLTKPLVGIDDEIIHYYLNKGYVIVYFWEETKEEKYSIYYPQNCRIMGKKFEHSFEAWEEY